MDALLPRDRPPRAWAPLALLVSGGAFAALFLLAAPPVVEVRPDPMPRALAAARIEPAAPLVGAALPAPALEAAPAPSVQVPDVAPPEPAPSVQVPDFVGARLSAARRQARALGLRIVARDESGNRVDASIASSFRVRRQLTASGAPAPENGVVEVRVRYAQSGYADGY